jgi:hypothetical protein
MRVRFSRLAGAACIVAAAAFGLLALLSDGVSFAGAMTPVAFLGFGIAVLTRPYLIVDDDGVSVKALIGSARETFRLGPADFLEFDGKRVFLVNASERRRLRGVSGWLANSHDWVAFRAWAKRRRGAGIAAEM